MNANRVYITEVQRHTQYVPTWLPTIAVSPGDVGTLRGYQYQPITNLRSLGIPFQTIRNNSVSSFDFKSADAVTISQKYAGQAPPDGSVLEEAEAGLVIEFSKRNAIVFNATDCRSLTVADLASVGTKIIELYNAGLWQKDYVLVTEVLKAGSATVFISTAANARIELVAKADIRGMSEPFDASAGLVAKREQSVGTKIVAQSGLTPLFRSMRIHDPLIGTTRFRALSEDAETSSLAEPKHETWLTDADYDTFTVQAFK